MSAEPSPKPAALVTGCAGFIASHLCQALLANGFAVAGVDNFISGKPENMAEFREHPDFAFFERPFESPGLLNEAGKKLPGLSLAFHLAAVVSVPWSMEHPEETLRVNHLEAVKLHAACRASGYKGFVFAGSAAEYGDDPRLPLSEDCASDATLQLSPYGRAKYLTSREIINSGFGASLRGFNIYGPRQDPSSPYSGVVSKFIARGLADQSLQIFGSGEQSRDFIYVADMVKAYLTLAGLANKPKKPCLGAFNAGRGKAVSVSELALTVQELTGGKSMLEHLPAREGDIEHSLADVSKLKALGFTAKTGLSKGLAATIEWFKNS